MERPRITAPALAGGATPAAAKRPMLDYGSLRRGAAWAAAVVAGSAVLFGIPGPVHISAPGARAAIETLIASWTLLSAAVLFVSFRVSPRRSDLLLLTALAAVGSTDFVFSALPALTGRPVLGSWSAVQVGCQALVALAIGVAAFAPVLTATRGEVWTVGSIGAVAGLTIALASVVALLDLPLALAVAFPGSGIAAAAEHPGLLIEGVLCSAVLLASGVVFFGRRERTFRALAGASFLLAAAHLQYLALPAVAPDWVTAREVLRLAAYGLVLVAALGRYARTRRAVAAVALAVERERIARDLHDGLAQDLAVIALHGQRLESELGDEHPLTVAARRAVATSRGVIVDLSASTAASTDAALRQVAAELAARFRTEVEVRIEADPAPPAGGDLDADRREDVVRIAREAIVNAARHGRAQHIMVALDLSGDQVRLRISDDGWGVPRATLPGLGGHGLRMMRARAAALGGRLATWQPAAGGLELEVTFPAERASKPRAHEFGSGVLGGFAP
jgi:signal transduction histidine kinase